MVTKEQLLEIIPKNVTYNSEQVVILENSSSLESDAASMSFREFLIDNKIRHNVIYNLSGMSESQLTKIAGNCLDTLVVFETTGTSDSFQFLVEQFIKLTNEGYRFKFMECSVYDFIFYGLPESIGEGCLGYYNLRCSRGLRLDNWQITQIEK